MQITKRHVIPIAVALLFGTLVGFFVINRTAPFEFVSGSVAAAAPMPGQPIPDKITAGGNVAVTITLKWNRLCDLESVRIVQDGEHKDWKIPSPPSTPPQKLHPGPLASVRVINIPAGATPGPSHYRATVYLRCNIFDSVWPIKVIVPPIPFVISPSG